MAAAARFGKIIQKKEGAASRKPLQTELKFGIHKIQGKSSRSSASIDDDSHAMGEREVSSRGEGARWWPKGGGHDLNNRRSSFIVKYAGCNRSDPRLEEPAVRFISAYSTIDQLKFMHCSCCRRMRHVLRKNITYAHANARP
jgi:hypothetical protein